jgi:hypothetical protein
MEPRIPRRRRRTAQSGASIASNKDPSSTAGHGILNRETAVGVVRIRRVPGRKRFLVSFQNSRAASTIRKRIGLFSRRKSTSTGRSIRRRSTSSSRHRGQRDDIKSLVTVFAIGMRAHFAARVDHMRSTVIEERRQSGVATVEAASGRRVKSLRVDQNYRVTAYADDGAALLAHVAPRPLPEAR